MLSWIFLIQIALWLFYDITYNLFFSPLAQFPGPKLWAFTRIPYQWHIMRGHSHRTMLALHDKLGPVIRVGPDELSFNRAQAFQDIYRARPGRPQYAKDPKFYGSSLNAVRGSIVGALDDKTHSRHRRLWANAFSERALRDHEGTIIHYADMLVDRLRAITAKGDLQREKVDMKEWFNFIAFDVTGDLLFAETFDCLKDSKLHPWIALIFAFVKGITLAGVINQFALLRRIQETCLPESLRQQMLKHFDLSAEKAERRLKKGTTRPDFMTAILKNGLVDSNDDFVEDPAIMSREEIHVNSALYVFSLLVQCVWLIYLAFQLPEAKLPQRRFLAAFTTWESIQKRLNASTKNFGVHFPAAVRSLLMNAPIWNTSMLFSTRHFVFTHQWQAVFPGLFRRAGISLTATQFQRMLVVQGHFTGPAAYSTTGRCFYASLCVIPCRCELLAG